MRRLFLHCMSPSVYNIAIPSVLGNTLRARRVDRGDGGCDFLYDLPVLGGHSIIAGDEYPGMLPFVMSNETPQQFRVLDILRQAQRCDVDGAATSGI